ncbi:MAG TPA: response regulator [Opitutaceae bacterium]|nr:response regulator [Opitutaceae bacterium]
MNSSPSEWTIALIDDKPDSQELISYAIKSTFPSIKLNAHASARDFINGFTKNRPTAVVTRQRLFGDMDGLSLARLLRSTGFPGPIVMITNAEELKNEAEKAGVNVFLSFDRWAELPSRLGSAINSYLEISKPLSA